MLADHLAEEKLFMIAHVLERALAPEITSKKPIV